MLKLVRHDEITAYFQAVEAFLLKEEVTHNLLLGVTERLIKLGKNMSFMAHVENESGAQRA